MKSVFFVRPSAFDNFEDMAASYEIIRRPIASEIQLVEVSQGRCIAENDFKASNLSRCFDLTRNLDD